MGERFAEKQRRMVAEQFAGHTAEHVIREAHRAKGYGHWKARNPKHGSFWFDIIVWPGVLMINGDCGVYAFSRVDDMIGFMTNPKGDGDADYVAEKVIAVDRNCLVREFSIEVALERTAEAIVDFAEDSDRWEEGEGLLELLRGLSSQEEHEALAAMYNSEIWDRVDLPYCKTFSFQFLWCLHAIRMFCAWHAKEYPESVVGETAGVGV